MPLHTSRMPFQPIAVANNTGHAARIQPHVNPFDVNSLFSSLAVVHDEQPLASWKQSHPEESIVVNTALVLMASGLERSREILRNVRYTPRESGQEGRAEENKRHRPDSERSHRGDRRPQVHPLSSFYLPGWAADGYEADLVSPPTLPVRPGYPLDNFELTADEKQKKIRAKNHIMARVTDRRLDKNLERITIRSFQRIKHGNRLTPESARHIWVLHAWLGVRAMQLRESDLDNGWRWTQLPQPILDNNSTGAAVAQAFEQAMTSPSLDFINLMVLSLMRFARELSGSSTGDRPQLLSVQPRSGDKENIPPLSVIPGARPGVREATVRGALADSTNLNRDWENGRGGAYIR